MSASPGPSADARERIESELLAWMGEDTWRGDDARFDRLALELFAFQFAANPPYRRFCEARGTTPERVTDWREVPAVPTGAFKEVALRCFPEARDVTVFRTSGTTGGGQGGRRGALHLDTVALYEASLAPSFQRHLLPELRTGNRMPIWVLAPPVAEAPDSSLSHMFSRVVSRFGSDASAFFVRGGALQREELVAAIAGAREPVALCGTAFSFVHLLDGGKEKLRLPTGSRVMETGGFKGRSRELAREELWRWMSERFELPESSIVNQYGMTELGSQFYDSVLAEPGTPRRKLGPPWARVRLVDPATSRDAAPGEPGLVTVHDLANTGSVAAVMTADLAVVVAAEGAATGFDVLGRQPGAEERGCSIAADLMLSR